MFFLIHIESIDVCIGISWFIRLQWSKSKFIRIQAVFFIYLCSNWLEWIAVASEHKTRKTICIIIRDVMQWTHDADAVRWNKKQHSIWTSTQPKRNECCICLREELVGRRKSVFSLLNALDTMNRGNAANVDRPIEWESFLWFFSNSFNFWTIYLISGWNGSKKTGYFWLLELFMEFTKFPIFICSDCFSSLLQLSLQ